MFGKLTTLNSACLEALLVEEEEEEEEGKEEKDLNTCPMTSSSQRMISKYNTNILL